MKKIVLFFFMMNFAVSLRAQDNFDQDSIYYTPIHKPSKENSIREGKRFNYFFTLSSGVLFGCSNCGFSKREITFSANTVHGTTIGKRIRAGIGAGYDAYYFWQSIPFSGTVSWDMIGDRNRNAVFVQVSYGRAKVWTNGYQEYGLKKIEGGQTATTQIGYRISYHDVKIALSAGTKFQEVTSSYEYPTYYYMYGRSIQGTSSTKSVQEKLNRLQLNLTVGWK